ncbi:hypothetical protein XENOCAPTIV_020601 [Xenoophorus captivus]|uniref:Uncharacterized protein n=1 Tax=Xenoophorus captivus TaxID=1517983 RepID=A0ABV0QJC0_9TELE
MWAGWGQLGSWLPVDDILCLGTHPIFTKISLGGNIAQQCLGCGMGLVGVGVTLQCSYTTLLVHILLLNFNAFETQRDVEDGGDLQISLPHPQSQLQPQFLCSLDICTKDEDGGLGKEGAAWPFLCTGASSVGTRG